MPRLILDDVMLTTRYDEALLYASELHRSQVRKGTRIPYVSHLLSVSALVLKNGGDEDQAIAGLLHDAAEDQGGKPTLDAVQAKFGDRVAGIVADCTDSWETPKRPWRERKEGFIASIPSKSRDSLLVSLADKTDNARAIMGGYREIGDDVWLRFSGKKEGVIWYYQSLSELFSKYYPSPLAAELARTVAVFSEA
jgi:(p)ppGpp synthase/HD superfamily hydrolase